MKKNLIKLLCAILIIFFLVSTLNHDEHSQRADQETGIYVILLHGLARSNRSMVKIEESLSSQGYKAINVSYPSTKHTIEFLVDEILGEIIERYSKISPSKIHFVTHSMGGIIIRYYLKHNKLPDLGRVVMISPPNQGSELVDRMKDTYIFKKINGPAGRQLGTKEDSIPLNLGPVDFELGVIAGNRSVNPLYSYLIPGPDDGVVSVERTKVKGMKDFLVLPHSHTFIMQSEAVVEQVIHFLKHGAFKRKAS
jgi:triacylglycerol lipase